MDLGSNDALSSQIITNVVGDVGNGGGCACVEVGGVQGISALTSQFCCGSKTVLKSSLLRNTDR